MPEKEMPEKEKEDGSGGGTDNSECERHNEKTPEE